MSISFNPSSVLSLSEALMLDIASEPDDLGRQAQLVVRAFRRFEREMTAYLNAPSKVCLGPVRKYKRLLDVAIADFDQAKRERRPSTESSTVR